MISRLVGHKFPKFLCIRFWTLWKFRFRRPLGLIRLKVEFCGVLWSSVDYCGLPNFQLNFPGILIPTVEAVEVPGICWAGDNSKWMPVSASAFASAPVLFSAPWISRIREHGPSGPPASFGWTTSCTSDWHQIINVVGIIWSGIRWTYLPKSVGEPWPLWPSRFRCPWTTSCTHDWLTSKQPTKEMTILSATFCFAQSRWDHSLTGLTHYGTPSQGRPWPLWPSRFHGPWTTSCTRDWLTSKQPTKEIWWWKTTANIKQVVSFMLFFVKVCT